MKQHEVIVDFFLATIGGATWLGAIQLNQVDLLVSVIFKFVSIISLSLIIVLNWKKVYELVIKKKEDDK